MNIKINNVQQLYDDVCALYNNEIETNGRGIVTAISDAITEFKSPTGWKGKDAGVQINNAINAHNSIAVAMNILGEIVVEISKITVRLREITNANGANDSDLSILSYENISKLDEYSDTSDTVFVSENAVVAKDNILKTNEMMDKFVEAIATAKTNLFDNWEMGGKREEALEAFNNTEKVVKDAKTTLNEVVESVKTAISNWENFNI